jgi:hypothetical protein
MSDDYDAYDYQGPSINYDNYDAYDYQVVNANVDPKSGNSTQTFDDGSTLTVDKNGNVVSSTNATDKTAIAASTDAKTLINKVVSTLGTGASDFLKKYLFDPTTGKINVAGLATAGAALYGLTNSNGYASSAANAAAQKPIPVLTASRQQIQYDDPNRRPGAQGRQYFTDTKYDGTSGDAQAQGIMAAYKPAAAPVANPYAGQMAMKYNPVTPTAAASINPAYDPNNAASKVIETMPVPNPADNMAQGGIAALARGGRFLSGETDGMADKIPTSIDGKQPAALSHGEFVIPADVVSHLGNGNSDAGAKKLYEMMARVRKARTGNPNQGKEINPDRFLSGGLAGYANGGGVMGFPDGGAVPAASAAASAGSPGITPDVTKSSLLAPYAADYVKNALAQGAAAADQGYQAYKGPLTAGPSDLQQQAFAGISDVAKAGYNPTTFTSNTFGSDQAQQYMNPYIKNVLDPQMAELKRQSDIQNLQNNTAATKAGAFGGGRQALMTSETNRNLLNAQNAALGQGYSNAYDKAMGQFNADQGRNFDAQKATEASRTYSADFGLKSLADLAGMGNIQRGIESEGMAADQKQFEAQRDYPMQAAQYKLNLLAGLPIGSTTTSSDAGTLANIQSSISGLASLYKTLDNLGVTTPTPTPPPVAKP